MEDYAYLERDGPAKRLVNGFRSGPQTDGEPNSPLPLQTVILGASFFAAREESFGCSFAALYHYPVIRIAGADI